MTATLSIEEMQEVVDFSESITKQIIDNYESEETT
jgi:hypothetical protein